MPWLRIILLAFMLFALYFFDFVGLSLTEEAQAGQAASLVEAATMPPGLRVAQVLELLGDTLAFGWIVAELLYNHQRSYA